MEQHKMEYTGANEWTCPICGRVMLLTKGSINIRNKGNPSARHSGSDNGLTDLYLQPFEDWLNENGTDLDSL